MNEFEASRHPHSALRVALTGGVGSGKSAVGALLAQLGAHIIDADAVAREIVEPGTPGLAAVLARFGVSVLSADGSLNRAGLASIVFSDAAALADLNAITHPLIGARSRELLGAVPASDIAIYEVPLLVEGGPFRINDFDLVVVVETAMDIRLDRLTGRGLEPDQARARIAAQASDAQRRAVADEIVVNNGTRADLEAEVGQLWARLRQRVGNSVRPGRPGGTASKVAEEIR